MLGRNILRVTVVALVLCTISFAAGVVGDLSEPPTTGVRVVLRIPPELPSDTPRAAPLPPMTSRAAAAEMRRAPRQLRVEAPVEVNTESVREVVLALTKPPVEWTLAEAKPDPDRGPKPENA